MDVRTGRAIGWTLVSSCAVMAFVNVALYVLSGRWYNLVSVAALCYFGWINMRTLMRWYDR